MSSWRVFGGVLVIGACTVLATMYVRDWDNLIDLMREANLGWLVVVILLGMVASFYNGVLFHLQLTKIDHLQLPFKLTGSLYFVGQLVRYLPGRVWGIVFQAAMSQKKISAPALIRCNLELMSLSLIMSLFVSAILWIMHDYLLAAIALAVVGTLVLLLVIRFAIYLRLFSWVCRQIPLGRFRLALGLSGEAGQREFQVSLTMALLLWGSWATYILGWSFLDEVIPEFGNVDLMRLCAIYNVAWVVGWLTMFSPAGLGVREGAFMLLAPALPADMAVVLLIGLRLWLTVAEMGLFLLFLPLMLVYGYGTKETEYPAATVSFRRSQRP